MAPLSVSRTQGAITGDTMAPVNDSGGRVGVDRSLLGRVVAVLVLVPSLITVARFLLLPLRDQDFFWHLKTGEWILEHQALPESFLFAAMPQGALTAMQHFTLTSYWLSQLLLQVVHAAGGVNGIIALRIGLYVLLVLLLALRTGGDRLIFLIYHLYLDPAFLFLFFLIRFWWLVWLHLY